MTILRATRFAALRGLLLAAALAAAEDRPRRLSDYEDGEPHADYVPARLLTELLAADKQSCPPCGYEPILSYGDYFLARVDRRSDQTLLAPYTKNGTILRCSVGAFCCGVVLGAVLLAALWRRLRPPLVSRSASAIDMRAEGGSDDSASADSARLEGLALEEGGAEAESAGPELKTPAKNEARPVVGSPTERKSGPGGGEGSDACATCDRDSARGAVADAKGVQDLTDPGSKETAFFGRVMPVLDAIERAQLRTCLGVESLDRSVRFVARRQEKKDLWARATDDMSFGILVTTVALFYCAFRYGRWQDWGLRCADVRFSLTVHYFFSAICCWIEEPVVFAVGLAVWWVTLRYACSSGLLKRKRPMSTVLLLAVLLSAGACQSFTVGLLGGSPAISFSVWVLYSTYLVQVMESTKLGAFSEAEGSNRAANSPIVGNETLSVLLAAFVFPLLAGALPFWNVGLSLSLSGAASDLGLAATLCARQAMGRFAEFLAH